MVMAMDTMDMDTVMDMVMDIMVTIMARDLLMLSQAMGIMDTMDMDMVMVTMDIMDNLQDFSLEWRTLTFNHYSN